MLAAAMISRPAFLGAIAVLAACGGVRPVPADALTTVVSLTKIDCADCGDQIVADLRERPGVYEASYDRRTAEVRVLASPTFDVFTAVRDGAARRGFDAILGAGRGQPLDTPRFPAGADVQVLARAGVDVPDLHAVLAQGKVTVVDFSASWCGPCRLVDEHMLEVLAVHHDVAYRKLEVGDWTTPLAQHYLQHVPRLPYVIVFAPGGALVASFSGVDLAGIDAAIATGVAGLRRRGALQDD